MSFLMVPRAPITTGTVVVLSPHVRSTSISKSMYLLSVSVVLTKVLSMRSQVLSFLFFSTMSGLLAAMVLLLLLLFISSFTVFVGVVFVHQPCTNHAPGASVTDSSQSFCPYTKHLPEDSGRSQHADLLGPCHSSSLLLYCYYYYYYYYYYLMIK